MLKELLQTGLPLDFIVYLSQLLINKFDPSLDDILALMSSPLHKIVGSEMDLNLIRVFDLPWDESHIAYWYHDTVRGLLRYL